MRGIHLSSSLKISLETISIIGFLNEAAKVTKRPEWLLINNKELLTKEIKSSILLLNIHFIFNLLDFFEKLSMKKFDLSDVIIIK